MDALACEKDVRSESAMRISALNVYELVVPVLAGWWITSSRFGMAVQTTLAINSCCAKSITTPRRRARRRSAIEATEPQKGH